MITMTIKIYHNELEDQTSKSIIKNFVEDEKTQLKLSLKIWIIETYRGEHNHQIKQTIIAKHHKNWSLRIQISH